MYFTDHLKFWLNYRASKTTKQKIQRSLNDAETNRLLHYIKLDTNFTLKQPQPVNVVSLFHKTGYAYDWYRIFDRSEDRLCQHLFGDISFVADQPSFCKSRPISIDNQNNVLMPLNTVRHFRFLNDDTQFNQKINGAVWRGAAYKEKRRDFLEKTKDMDLCNTADTSPHSGRSLTGTSKNFMSLQKQLRYKFVFAIEGNDVASNLKWAMSSNSAVIMPKPTKETWFCESFLEPGRHFIEIRPDYADIEEKLDYFLDHPIETQEIIGEANRFCEPFKDLERQFEIARLVADKYFSLLAEY
jgi:hypothetical protein